MSAASGGKRRAPRDKKLARHRRRREDRPHGQPLPPADRNTRDTAMPINVTCTGCASTMKVPDNVAGKRVKCPKCANVLTVPAANGGFEDQQKPLRVSLPPPVPEM